MRLNRKTSKIIAPLIGAAIAILIGSETFLPHSLDTAAPPSGSITAIIDGDTLLVGEMKIRLWGVDAPEHHQPGYFAAGAFLEKQFLGKDVACKVRDHDKHRRSVAQCRTKSDDQDIGAVIIRAGLARDYTHHSNGYYLKEEIQAKRARIGLWATPEKPSRL